MTSKRGRDIYEATEKDYDTSGYRKAVCKKWLDEQQAADFYSPTILEPRKHGQKHRTPYPTPQKFIDINETAKSSQRRESSLARRHNNNDDDDDFIEPSFGYKNRSDKAQGHVAKTKQTQPLPMSHKNEKEYEKPYRSSQNHGKSYRKSQENPYNQHPVRSSDTRRPEKQTNISDNFGFGEFDFEFPLDDNVDFTKHNDDARARKQKNGFGDENGGSRAKTNEFDREFGDERGIRSAKKRKNDDSFGFDDENRGRAKKNGFGDEHCGSRARKQKKEVNDFGCDFEDFRGNEPMIQHKPRRHDDKHVAKAKHTDRNSKPFENDFSPEPRIVKQGNCSGLFDASPAWKGEKNERSKAMDRHRSNGISNQKHGERHTIVRYEGENRKSKHNGIGLVSNEVALIGDPPTKSNKNIHVLTALDNRTPTGSIVYQINVYTNWLNLCSTNTFQTRNTFIHYYCFIFQCYKFMNFFFFLTLWMLQIIFVFAIERHVFFSVDNFFCVFFLLIIIDLYSIAIAIT